MRRQRRRARRSGNILVLTAFMMIGMFALIACAVDLGYLQVVDAELQRSADAAAIAATWELLGSAAANGGTLPEDALAEVRNSAAQYSAFNHVTTRPPLLAESDVQIGNLNDPSDPNAPWRFDDPNRFNAVRVRIRKTAEINGRAPLFFAKVLGSDSCGMQAEATAAFLNNLAGFRTPTNGENLDILPFALDEDTWVDLIENENGPDVWAWVGGQIVPGSDDDLEVNLYPQGTGSPGNRGTVDIGSNNNSTADIARQILYGISEQDLAYHGGKLEFDENHEMFLNGDTGISAGVKDELAAIKGQPRCIPLFKAVAGPGNNATYTISRFVGVRIMDVKLTGSMNSKRVIVQPAPCIVCGGIPAPWDAPTTSYVYSPVWLVR